MEHPLEGVKVIELARILAGPWAGQTLSDLGAEVVKVESIEEMIPVDGGLHLLRMERISLRLIFIVVTEEKNQFVWILKLKKDKIL